MPKFLERKLRAGASKAGLTGRAADRYVYGAENNMGAMHGNKETAKGRAMEAKHDKETHDDKGGGGKGRIANLGQHAGRIENLGAHAKPKKS